MNTMLHVTCLLSCHKMCIRRCRQLRSAGEVYSSSADNPKTGRGSWNHQTTSSRQNQTPKPLHLGTNRVWNQNNVSNKQRFEWANIRLVLLCGEWVFKVMRLYSVCVCGGGVIESRCVHSGDYESVTTMFFRLQCEEGIKARCQNDNT